MLKLTEVTVIDCPETPVREIKSGGEGVYLNYIPFTGQEVKLINSPFKKPCWRMKLEVVKPDKTPLIFPGSPQL